MKKFIFLIFVFIFLFQSIVFSFGVNSWEIPCICSDGGWFGRGCDPMASYTLQNTYFLSSCGGCGNVKVFSSDCYAPSGPVTAVCSTNYVNCDSTGGCETNINKPNGVLTSCSSISCDPGWGNCDGNVANGCETELNSIENCGGCGNDCTKEDCSGSEFGVYKGDLTICENYCHVSEHFSPICDFRTKKTGSCRSDLNCVSDLSCKNEVEGFYYGTCCGEDECGHANVCYEENSQILINNKYYYCKLKEGGVDWERVPKILKVSKLLTKSSNMIDMTNKTYLDEKGITNICDKENFTSATFDGPFYARQYCSNLRVAFDGIMNVEVGVNIPVRVSEQELHDPYGVSKKVELDNDLVGDGWD